MFKTAFKKAIKKKTEAIGYLIDNEITKRGFKKFIRK